ncbi:hypothetical protein P8452_60897 [Trifolium repens]|nr:hypothetical protein P8452_60897 [Trifolium repens]
MEDRRFILHRIVEKRNPYMQKKEEEGNWLVVHVILKEEKRFSNPSVSVLTIALTVVREAHITESSTVHILEKLKVCSTSFSLWVLASQLLWLEMAQRIFFTKQFS